jgi:hypothetical protein
VVEASWQALVDSVEFKLHKDNVKPRIPTLSTGNGAHHAADGKADGTVKRATKNRRAASSVGSIAAKL